MSFRALVDSEDVLAQQLNNAKLLDVMLDSDVEPDTRWDSFICVSDIVKSMPLVSGWIGPHADALVQYIRYQKFDSYSNEECEIRMYPHSNYIKINVSDFWPQHMTMRMSVDAMMNITQRQLEYCRRAAMKHLSMSLKHYRRVRDMCYNNRSRVRNYSFRETEHKRILVRHYKLVRKVRQMHELAKTNKPFDADLHKAWLRVLRHVGRDPALVAYSEDECESMKGKVSYGRYPMWPAKKRVRCKFSKYMAAAGVPNSLVGVMAQAWAAEHAIDADVRVVYGGDIQNAYENSYGSTSCMTGGGAEFATMYQCNPDKIGLALLYTDGEIEGRALLWKLDPPEEDPNAEPELYLDRPYPQCDRVRALFQHWAQKQGIQHTYMTGGLPNTAECTIDLDDNQAVAYMDSFSTFKALNNYRIRLYADCRGPYDACCQDGGPFLAGRVECDGCGESFHEDDCVGVGLDTYCCHCYSDMFSECDICSCTTHNDDCVYTEDDRTVCDTCYDMHYSGCDICNDVVHNSDINLAVSSELDMAVCERCAEDSVTTCDDCNNHVLLGYVHNTNGDELCESCYEERIKGENDE